MRIYLMLYLILSGLQVMIGQNNPVDTNATFVIANGGLILRYEPNMTSIKLGGIPFGATVKYLSDQSFNVDSVLINKAEKKAISGNWVKVEYKKKQGYVLDIYLSRPPKDNQRFSEKYDPDFILLYPGCGCDAENLHDPKAWKWFGYFKRGTGEYRVEEIEISYYRTSMYTCELIVAASKNDSLSFVIGSKNSNWADRKVVTGKTVGLKSPAADYVVKKSDLAEISLGMVENKNNKTGKSSELYLIKGQQKQLLNKPEYDYPNEVKFVGDLDGDGKDDYIIQYGDKSSVIILYLTSKAKAGKLIEKAAMFFASYCC